MRVCSRTACQEPAVATLTYAYSDSTAVLGPLATAKEPGSLDLCARHAERTSVPRGCDVIRLPMSLEKVPEVADDELTALAEAVRAIGLRHDDPEPEQQIPVVEPPALRTVGHLRLLPGG